jgi:hypothetical protein
MYIRAMLARSFAQPKSSFSSAFLTFRAAFHFSEPPPLCGEAAQNPANGVPSPFTLSPKGLFAASAVRLIQSA